MKQQSTFMEHLSCVYGKTAMPNPVLCNCKEGYLCFVYEEKGGYWISLLSDLGCNIVLHKPMEPVH